MQEYSTEHLCFRTGHERTPYTIPGRARWVTGLGGTHRLASATVLGLLHRTANASRDCLREEAAAVIASSQG